MQVHHQSGPSNNETKQQNIWAGRPSRETPFPTCVPHDAHLNEDPQIRRMASSPRCDDRAASEVGCTAAPDARTSGACTIRFFACGLQDLPDEGLRTAPISAATAEPPQAHLEIIIWTPHQDNATIGR